MLSRFYAEAVEPNDANFQSYLTEHQITVSEVGKSCQGFPECEFIGEKSALRELINTWFAGEESLIGQLNKGKYIISFQDGEFTETYSRIVEMTRDEANWMEAELQSLAEHGDIRNPVCDWAQESDFDKCVKWLQLFQEPKTDIDV